MRLEFLTGAGEVRGFADEDGTVEGASEIPSILESYSRSLMLKRGQAVKKEGSWVFVGEVPTTKDLLEFMATNYDPIERVRRVG